MAAIQSEVIGCTCQYTYNVPSDCIGSGGFGFVYQAEITDPGDYIGERTVAVKVVQLEQKSPFLASQEKWRYLTNNLRLLLTLSHTHLVRYHKVTVSRTRGGACLELMMDYCQGGDLHSFLKGQANSRAVLDYATAVQLILDIGKGLNYLHSENIIHGDIKPKNVLLKQLPDGQTIVVIADLDDLVKMQRSNTVEADISHLRGTIRYIAPEMVIKFLNPPTEYCPGRKADVWSLGCVMLDIANVLVKNDKRWLGNGDKRVEAGSRMSDHYYAALVCDGYIPVIIDSIPAPLSTCIRLCLMADSTQRISAGELVEMLLEAADIVLYTRPELPKQMSSDVEEKFTSAAESQVSTNEMEPVSIPYEEAGNHAAYHDYSHLIAQGNFAKIYKTSTKGGSKFGKAKAMAIKVVHLHKASEVLTNPEQWKETYDKLLQLCCLSHNHIVDYQKVTITKTRGGAFVECLMDYYDGGDLSFYMKQLLEQKARLEPELAVRFAKDVADGLNYLHRNDIIHGNIKPENILITDLPDGHHSLAICDLDNIVTMESSEYSRNLREFVDAYRYMSPEMLKRQSEPLATSVGRATDVWSLGCIMIELLCQSAGNYHGSSITDRYEWDAITPGDFGSRSCSHREHRRNEKTHKIK